MGAEVEPWVMSTDDMITAPVEIYDGVVYVGSNDKSMCAAVGQFYRKLLWRRDFPAPIVTQFHLDRRGCFVGTLNGEIFILKRKTGEKIKIPDEETKVLKDWGPFICNGQIRDPIQVSRNTIFQRARKDKFYAISIRAGNLRWTNPHGRTVLAVIAPNVYLLDKDRTLLIVDEATGKIKASVPMGGWELFVPNTSLGAIYAASPDGMLCCIRPKGSGHLTVNMLNPRVTTKPAKEK
jgi:outer membrane protein assembly factor BamB